MPAPLAPPAPPNDPASERAPSLRERFGLNPQTGGILGGLFLVSLGEELWSPYLPHYLDALGASLIVIGLWSAGKNLLEGFLFWGGGALSHRLGERGTLALVGLLPVLGYLVFLFTDSVPAAIVASFLVGSWEAFSVPATFAVVGRTLAQSHRTSAFALQSIQKRLPRIAGPWIGGVVLATLGIAAGMRALLAVALATALVAILVQWRFVRGGPPEAPARISKREVWRAMPGNLRQLWWSDVLVRWGDWLARDFIVLYCVKTLGISTALFGTLVAVQMTTALLTYVPIAAIVDRGHQRPFIGLTFVLFALTPLFFALARGPSGLVLAFLCYGLREIGEPARKSMITSSFPPEYRARGVGLSWGWRAFAIFPAPLVGALLWMAFGPRALLAAACGVGLLGAALFIAFSARPRP